MALQPGERIDHYTIVQKLGHGGMSQVYLADDSVQQRVVVLIVAYVANLLPSFFATP